MTLDRCVELVRELRALERLCATIARVATHPDWQDALTVLNDRVFWLRGCLRLEDPQLMRDVDAILDAERMAVAASVFVEVPPGRSIH